jgi:diaminohydroxyphosphoribosylaminopyrimidine deaminase/5-amino-6-(5-phosphoribosylamino)uracil reductase
MAEAFTPQEKRYMERALRLAVRGQGKVEPNPMVGCVLVRNDKIVGESYHNRYGQAHAEANALKSAGQQARDAIAYVTLEPCCFTGKTPPCTQALIQAGVRRVVIAMEDPNPKVSGKGMQKLQAAGIQTAVGLCKDEALALNAPFCKLQRTGRPWIILKWAQSLDGKIATRTGHSQWITSQAARKQAHRLRGKLDGIIVGAGTVAADDPLLTCRHLKPKRIATRIVLDPELSIKENTQLLKTTDQAPTLIVTATRAVQTSKAESLRKAGAEVLGVPLSSGSLDLAALLGELGNREMTNVMVEGGGRTLGAFFDANLMDEAVVFVARKLIGGRQAVSPLNGEGLATVDQVLDPVSTRVSRVGPDDMYRIVFSR